MPLDEKNDDEEAVYVQHQSSNRWKLPSHERPSKTRASRANVPITVRIDDIVTKEQEPAYLEWQRGISSAQERFVADRFGKDAVCMLLRKSSMKNSSRCSPHLTRAAWLHDPSKRLHATRHSRDRPQVHCAVPLPES